MKVDFDENPPFDFHTDDDEDFVLIKMLPLLNLSLHCVLAISFHQGRKLFPSAALNIKC